MPRRRFGFRHGGAAAFLGVLLLQAAGCSPYRLQGVVVAGEFPGVEVVADDDPRLDEVGTTVSPVPGVSLEVLLDPERLSPKRIGRGNSGRSGAFALAIDEPGAGLLLLDIELNASRDGFVSVRDRLQLPGSHQRLIITLQRGKDRPSYEPDNILEKTLRDAQPYLRD